MALLGLSAGCGSSGGVLVNMIDSASRTLLLNVSAEGVSEGVVAWISAISPALSACRGLLPASISCVVWSVWLNMDDGCSKLSYGVVALYTPAKSSSPVDVERGYWPGLLFAAGRGDDPYGACGAFCADSIGFCSLFGQNDFSE